MRKTLCPVQAYKNRRCFDLPFSLTEMNRRLHVVYANSASSSNYHPENRIDDFTLSLAQPLQLDPVGEWFCCLRQCAFGFSFPGPLYVCCDVCEESTAGSKRLPVLRVVHQRKEVIYSNCLYVPLKVRDISQLRIYLLRTVDYAPPGYDSTKTVGPSHLTLEFRRGLGKVR